MIPPLSQSKQSLLACPHSYVEQIVKGHLGDSSEAARRGTAIHVFLSCYTNFLVHSRKKKDLDAWDFGLAGLSPEAIEILDGIRDKFEIDPEKVFATELYIGLDENFSPVFFGSKSRLDPTLPSVRYEMTLDMVTLDSETEATIDDYKSNFQAFEADTFQGKLYSLGLFMLNPKLERVTFKLQFVRWNRDRKVTYTRADVPEIQKQARAWREVLIRIHEHDAPGGNRGEALPGSHCAYCPLLAAGCPIEKNPYQDPIGQLRNVLYFKQALKRAEEAVRANADRLGPLVAVDGIGTEYQAAWGVRETRKFDILCLPVLLEWDKAKGDNLCQKVSVSGLTTPLKAKMRKDLTEKLSNFCEIDSQAIFKVGKVKEDEDEAE